MTNQHVCYIHTLIYISDQKPYILYAIIIFILSPRQLYISSTSCVFLLYRPHGSLCTKKQETIYHFALQLILCRHCIFFVQEEERDNCRLRKTLLCFDASNSSHFLLIFLLKPQNLASTYITYILHLLRTICFSAETVEIKITLVDDMFSVCI